MEKFSFKINMTITGVVAATKTNKEDIDAKVQFININDEGMQNIDVKIVGAKKNDLQQFTGKKVILKNVIMAQVDFNKYYKVDNITNIELLK